MITMELFWYEVRFTEDTVDQVYIFVFIIFNIFLYQL